MAHVVAGCGIGLAFLGTNQQGIDLLERWMGELAVRNTMATPKVDSSDTTIDAGPNRELEILCVQRKCVPLRVATAEDLEQAKERTAALASLNPGGWIIRDRNGQFFAKEDVTI